MIQPNSDAIGFCNWMLNISKQYLSGPQKVIVNEVYNAAIGNYPVSNQTWYNFNLFSAWRNKFYLVYKEYAFPSSPALLMNLAASYNFDGNSTDGTGNYPATDTNMIYGIPYGRVNEGAYFNGINAGVTNAGMAFGANKSFSFWLNPLGLLNPYAVLLGNAAFAVTFYYEGSNNSIAIRLPSGTTYYSLFAPGSWSHVVITMDTTTVFVYINNVLVASLNEAGLITSFNYIGAYPGSYYYGGSMDILLYYTRYLDASDVAALFNGGAAYQPLP